eukprot:Filipodium_phascolosomae@DN7535_c0_g1_i1.p1
MAPTKSPRRSEILKGKVFSIIGTLSVTRKVAESMIRRNGGDYKTKVSSLVTHLISAREPDDTADRYRNLTIISEQDLHIMIHKGSGDLLRSKSLKQEMLCASCKSNKNLNSKGCDHRSLLCSICGFEC